VPGDHFIVGKSPESSRQGDTTCVRNGSGTVITVCFVAIGSEAVGEADGVEDVALGQVKNRAATWVAWSMLAVFAAGLAFTAILAVLNGSVAGDRAIVLYLPAFTAFMVVGALVVARRPANAIGWMFSAIALLALSASLASEYSQYAYVTRPGGLPFGVVTAWYLAWVAFPLFGLIFTFTLLLFPTGRLLSARWKPFAWLAGIEITATSVLAALQPTLPLEYEGGTIPNPIGISGLPHPEQGAVGAVLTSLLFIAALAGCASLVLRFRRARGEERQQLKWFAYAAALMVISTAVVGVTVPGGSDLGGRCSPTSCSCSAR
jgi:hypothetical protein